MNTCKYHAKNLFLLFFCDFEHIKTGFRRFKILVLTVVIKSPIYTFLLVSSRGTKKSQFRSYRRRKAKNAPKTKKSQQMSLSRKEAILGPPRRRKTSFTCLRRKKASLRRPRAKNYNKRHFAPEKNRNLLGKILLILLISRTRNLESIY